MRPSLAKPPPPLPKLRHTTAKVKDCAYTSYARTSYLSYLCVCYLGSVSGTAARDAARSERALGERKAAGKARAKRKRQEARARGREAAEAAGSGAAASM